MRSRSKVTIPVGLALLVGLPVAAVQPAVACVDGCAPGLWKQEVHFWVWPNEICVEPGWHWTRGSCDPAYLLPIVPETELGEIFDLCYRNGDLGCDTLVEALNYADGSGLEAKARILLRYAVEELLSGMTMDLGPPLAAIDRVETALCGLNTQFPADSGNWIYVPGGCNGNLCLVKCWA